MLSAVPPEEAKESGSAQGVQSLRGQWVWSHQQGAVKVSISLAGYDKSGVHCGVRRPTAWHPGVCYSKSYSSVTPLSGLSFLPQEWTEACPSSEEPFTPTLQQHWDSKVSPEEFCFLKFHLSLSVSLPLFSTFSYSQEVSQCSWTQAVSQRYFFSALNGWRWFLRRVQSWLTK